MNPVRHLTDAIDRTELRANNAMEEAVLAAQMIAFLTGLLTVAVIASLAMAARAMKLAR